MALPSPGRSPLIGCGFTRRASGGSGVPLPPSPDVTTKRKARRGGPGDRKVWLRDEVRRINGQVRRLVSSLLNACASFPQGGRLPVDLAGTAQLNPLLYYTKKIVLMPPSTIIVGTAHMMKMKGMFFSSPLAQ